MSPPLTVRRLTESDADLLLSSEAFDHPADPEQTRRFLADRGNEIVAAIEADHIIGFATGVVLLHPDKQPAFFINEVGVNESHRQRGIATELVRVLISVARALGCRGIWLATEHDNTPARALYNKLNARETGRIVVYDWDGAMDD